MRRLMSLIGLVLVAACSSSPSGPGGGGGNDDEFTASIDGAPWEADPLTISAAANTSQLPGGLLFSGGTLVQPSRGVVISLGRIPGPGTYPLGVNTGTSAGGVLTMTFGTTAWSTPLNGDAGTITITSMTGGRVRGNFTADLVRFSGTGGADEAEVRSGEFNVSINPGWAAPPADDLGSRVWGSVGTTAEWNAATVVGLGGGTGAVGFTASNTEYMITVSASPPAQGTLPLSNNVPLRTITVARTPAAGGGGWGTIPGATGTVTINSVSANRIAGTLTVSLPAIAVVTGSINVSLQFDVRTAQ